MAASTDIKRMRDKVSIVGIGDTDYGKDYAAHRDGKDLPDSYGYATIAFQRALADSGLTKDKIDGVIVAGPITHGRTCEVLGLNPSWTAAEDAGRAIIQATLWINTGMAKTVALIYGNAQRSGGTQYGGARAAGGEQNLSYIYYAPWGMTSQGALYAMMFRRHMELYGTTEHQLGHVAVSERNFAINNQNAVMQRPLTIDDYLQSRFICEPLRLNDYCLVNDGGVSLILTSTDRAKTLPKPPVQVSGFAAAELHIDSTQLRPRMIDFYRPAHEKVKAKVYEAAGVSQREIDSVQIYDSFTCHVLFALEGFGFCPIGEGGAFVESGSIAHGGILPINTSGGMLSESYMQGWNHQIEIARQLRGESGLRQVPDCNTIQYICDASGKCTSIVYRKA